MRQNRLRQSGISKLRLLFATIICSIGALLALVGSSASPVIAADQRSFLPAGVMTAKLRGKAFPPLGKSWAIVPSPNTESGYNALNGVTCISPSDCWAVGTYKEDNDIGSDQTLFEHWDGNTWTLVPVPHPDSYEDLFDVACASSADCWAVGIDESFSTGRTPTLIIILIMHWDGASWTTVNAPGLGFVFLYGVTCTSGSDCWAVGFDGGQMHDRTFIEHWDGSSWSIINSPNSDPTEDNKLWDVTCASASDCWSVGYQTNVDGYRQTLTEHWDGISWSIIESPNTNRMLDHELFGVTCVSSGDCWAVGYSGDFNIGPPIQTLIEHWNGTVWSIVNSADADPAGSNVLYGVACTSALNCWVVGSFSPPFIEHWDGNAWTLTPAPNHGSDLSGLMSVACAFPHCWAVGSYSADANITRTLIEGSTMFPPAPPPTPRPSATPKPTTTPGFTPSPAPRPSSTPK